MKNDVEELKKTEEQQEIIQGAHSQNLQTDEYKIYNYLRKNPGLFAGSGAALVAVLSALIAFCSYIYESASLKYWNIDPVYINLNTANRLYGTIASFVFICVLFALYSVIDMLAEKSMAVRQKEIYLKKIKSEYWKEVMKSFFNKVYAYCLRKPNDRSLETHASKAKNAIKNLNKAVNAAKKGLNRQIVAHLFLVDIVLFLSMCIWLCVGMTDYSTSILIMILASALVSTLLVVTMYLIIRSSFADGKRIREEAVNQYESLEIQTDVTEISLPLKKLLSGDYNIKQSDRKIKRAIANCLLLTVLVVAGVLLSFQFLGHQKAEGQTQFMITSENGIEYAVIYNNGENAIIAKCSEHDDILTIDSASQKVVSIEGLEYEIRLYEKAEKGRIPDDISHTNGAVNENK